MNKYILWIIGVLVIVFLVFAVNTQNGKKQEKNKQVASIITIEKIAHNFGDINIFGGKVSATYTLKNGGDEDVKIISAVTSCMCTEGDIGGLKFGMHESSEKIVIIPAGGEEILTATFDPLAHGLNGTGKVTRQLMLKTNSTETPEIEVRFEANVIKNENE